MSPSPSADPVMKTLAIVLLVPSGAGQQAAHNRFQGCCAGDRLNPLATLERKPALIEAIEHLHAWRRIPHALGTEQRLPFCPRDRVRSYRAAEQLAENGGKVVW